MRKIEKTVTIHAPSERVWRVLTDNLIVKIWYNEFSEGTYAISDWKEGSKIIWADPSNSGMVGIIVTADKGKKLDIEFTGEYVNGEEVYDSEMAGYVKGSHETYVLEEKDGSTTLSISVDMDEQHYDSMSEAWDRAFVLIGKLAMQG